MKLNFLLVIAFLTLISCKQEQKITLADVVSLSSNLSYKENKGNLYIKSGKFTYEFKKDQIPFKKVILLNSSLLGYISEIGAENTVIGVSSPEYIYSEKVSTLIKTGMIQNVGNEQKYDVEKIISLKPDAIFTNYIASFDNTYQLLKNNGIHIVFLDEYMEQEPLKKTAYIKLFGKLFGKEELAEQKFAEIKKNYNDLKQLASTSKSQPEVLANEMYGDIWYLPGGKTFTANYILDAHADYILKDNVDEKAVTMSFEEVYAKSQKTQYWVNVGNHLSKQELLNINPYYSKLEVFNTGKIYGVTAREKQKSNDFFESGVVRADIILKDYIKIFHPELLPDYKLTYLKELQ
ncbi:ABC transporter substrate-binding protein [Chryseobacterium chendengshani]|uniref:ABC transporter substrate-binding protein n=1 Tax=Chryseobacterium sp. LJ668 TaxID=2864040 RepID=UPI001C68B218|nr:ABC transporter substrate-binding protein [Chryseobacterium sp. LJ668]MBW8523533.1 ABC transporter substrate-binding protein [Chryseobacterium sp. LJ668]QYK15816.1 ABC transporter substrate-binding protein [Chryseobacterium sp. LJ668]